jgi:hypothetical protein
MTTKVCTKCREEKSAQEFQRHRRSKDGRFSYCKACVSEYQKEWYKENRDKRREYLKLYLKQNPEKRREYDKKYRKRNRGKIRKYEKARRSKDPAFRLAQNLRVRLGAVLNGKTKPQPTLEMLGCSLGFLKFWLQMQFKQGMTWENHGEWHVDHIVPLALVDMNAENWEDRLRKLNHFTNLQPLSAGENFRKSGRIGFKRLDRKKLSIISLVSGTQDFLNKCNTEVIKKIGA